MVLSNISCRLLASSLQLVMSQLQSSWRVNSQWMQKTTSSQSPAPQRPVSPASLLLAMCRIRNGDRLSQLQAQVKNGAWDSSCPSAPSGITSSLSDTLLFKPKINIPCHQTNRPLHQTLAQPERLGCIPTIPVQQPCNGRPCIPL